MDSGQHELNRFFDQAAALMRLEYERIHVNASKDPGTAGDEGEENWGKLLAAWLPPAYHVITKGQLINTDGELSPQIDVLVLDPTYPPHLRQVKKYLADLVVAAFECKLTLRKADITKTVENAKKIRRLFKPRKGNLYSEAYSPIVYGLLAHTQELASDTQSAAFKIAQTLYECDEKIIEHPREMLDFVCVSDLITISRATQGYLHFNDGLFVTYHATLMSKQWSLDKDHVQDSQPLAQMFSGLLRRLAREDPSLVRLVRYFRDANVGNATGGGAGRLWSLKILSRETLLEMTRSHDAFETGNRGEWDNLVIV